MAVMADWLTLHGLTADDCRARLTLTPLSVTAPPDPALPDPAKGAVDVVLTAIARALPQASATLDFIRAEVQIDLAPDRQRFPRAFTLHDNGRGRPFISCPLRGRQSDLLVLAHEIGHTCQIIASGQPDLVPVLRETAAYLAEHLLVDGAEPEQKRPLARLLQARRAKAMIRDGDALRRALDDPMQAYHYNWNYPLARDLAARAAQHLTADETWQVFSGKRPLSQLWQLAPALGD